MTLTSQVPLRELLSHLPFIDAHVNCGLVFFLARLSLWLTSRIVICTCAHQQTEEYRIAMHAYERAILFIPRKCRYPPHARHYYTQWVYPYHSTRACAVIHYIFPPQPAHGGTHNNSWVLQMDGTPL